VRGNNVDASSKAQINHRRLHGRRRYDPKDGEVERSRKPEPRTKQEVRVENTKDTENTNEIILFEIYFFSVSFAFSMVKKSSRLTAPSGALRPDET